MKVRLFGVLVAAALMVLAAPPASASFSGEYLALGDSVAFGFNPNLVPSQASNPGVFVGYPDIVAQRLGLQLTNASCPGETSGGFISTTNGQDYRCLAYRFFFPLHVQYPGAQLAFALQFLSTHSDVQLVTMDIGANDVFKLETDICNMDATCIQNGLPAVLTGIDLNLRFIYAELRNAAHYHGIIATLNYYSLLYDEASETATQALNFPIGDATTANGGIIASGFDAFEARAEAHANSSCAAGLLIINLTTGVCDVHPSPLGRDALAGAIVRAVEQVTPSD